MSTNNQAELGGLMSNKVRLRTVNNRLELVKPNKRKVKPLSPRLEAFREKFTTAARYASRMIKNDQSREEYAKGINKQKRTAFQVDNNAILTSLFPSSKCWDDGKTYLPSDQVKQKTFITC